MKGKAHRWDKELRVESMDYFSEFSEGREIRLLFIDDDKWIRESMEMYFEGGGCLLTVCETAEEGLEALRNQDHQAVIADYLLPGMDGLQFFKLIRDSHPSLVKILITAYGSQKVFSQAQFNGVDAVIEKPFTVEALKQSLSQLLQDKALGIGHQHKQEEGSGQQDC